MFFISYSQTSETVSCKNTVMPGSNPGSGTTRSYNVWPPKGLYFKGDLNNKLEPLYKSAELQNKVWTTCIPPHLGDFPLWRDTCYFLVQSLVLVPATPKWGALREITHVVIGARLHPKRNFGPPQMTHSHTPESVPCKTMCNGVLFTLGLPGLTWLLMGVS